MFQGHCSLPFIQSGHRQPQRRRDRLDLALGEFHALVYTFLSVFFLSFEPPLGFPITAGFQKMVVGNRANTSHVTADSQKMTTV